MAKRFTSTEIWSEDWFLEMPIEYKLFWYYMLSSCDHAGLFKVNLRSFCGLNEVKVSSSTALTYFNVGKQRIRVISESVWYIEDFFVYQYGTTFNVNNRLHESIYNLYKKQNIDMTSIRGLLDLKDTPKDKDKDKDIKEGGMGETKTQLPIIVPLVLELSESEKKFAKFQEWLKKDAPAILKMKEPITQKQYDALCKDFDKYKDELKETFLAMHNKKDLLTKYTSANLTLRNWIKRRIETPIIQKSNGKLPYVNSTIDINGTIYSEGQAPLKAMN